MRNFLLISLILLSLLACESNKPGKDLLPPETLVPVLVDLQLLYAIQSTQSYRSLSRRVDSVNTHSYIFEKHGITKAEFDSTVSWYSRNPKQYIEIYDEVIMDLSQIADSLGLGREQ